MPYEKTTKRGTVRSQKRERSNRRALNKDRDAIRARKAERKAVSRQLIELKNKQDAKEAI